MSYNYTPLCVAMVGPFTSAERWEHDLVVKYIQQHGFSRITLQFPDDLLEHAPRVAQELQQLLQQQGSGAKVYVLADTSYNPLSIDEVAAAHVKADCVVHYGYASLHPVSRTPALCVLPKRQLDVQQTSTWLLQQLDHLHQQVQAACSQQQQRPLCVVCCDQGYLHQLPELQQAVLQAYAGSLQLLFAHGASTELWPQGRDPPAAAGTSCCAATGADPPQPDSSSSVAGPVPVQAVADATAYSTPVPIGGLVWQLPSSDTGSAASGADATSTSSAAAAHMVWLGPASSPALTHLQLSHAAAAWLVCDPDSQAVHAGLSPGLERLLKRRYYLVERARGSSLVGLLVGTLGAAGYKAALEQLRRLAAEAGKKTYTLLMGKPNPAKLANFPEVEVFVMLADPQGLILDSKDYLAPIITPHEAFLAFTGRDFEPARYRLDFGDLLQLQQGQQVEDAAAPGGPHRGQQQPAGGGASVCGNITELDGSEEGEEGEDSVQQLSAAAGALVIAGGSHSQALTGNSSGKQVQVHSAAQYLTQRRTYQGLETPATGGAILPAAVAVVGRSGRAAGYVDEPQQ